MAHPCFSLQFRRVQGNRQCLVCHCSIASSKSRNKKRSFAIARLSPIKVILKRKLAHLIRRADSRSSGVHLNENARRTVWCAPTRSLLVRVECCVGRLVRAAYCVGRLVRVAYCVDRLVRLAPSFVCFRTCCPGDCASFYSDTFLLVASLKAPDVYPKL
jgi:hypothetical protein